MKVIVFFWVHKREDETGFKHGEEVELQDVQETIKKLNKAGFYVMFFTNTSEETIMAIDDKRFTQR